LVDYTKLVVAAAGLVVMCLACGGSETDDSPTSSSAGGGGGSGGEGGGGRATSATVGSGVPSCVGCGEFVTTSAPEPELCDAASLDLFVAMQECLCTNCEGTCGVACRYPGTECSACRLMAAQTTCKSEWDACASDL
jgi:hypothetical protein